MASSVLCDLDRVIEQMQGIPQARLVPSVNAQNRLPSLHPAPNLPDFRATHREIDRVTRLSTTSAQMNTGSSN
jgi:hypothetical protein